MTLMATATGMVIPHSLMPMTNSALLHALYTVWQTAASQQTDLPVESCITLISNYSNSAVPSVLYCMLN